MVVDIRYSYTTNTGTTCLIAVVESDAFAVDGCIAMPPTAEGIRRTAKIQFMA